MKGPASDRLSHRYELRLPPDLASWLDGDVWRQGGSGEFAHALAPAQMVDPEPGTIWGGFMPPDVLPVVGNNYGDWLCLRVAPGGEVSEVIYWSHVGGDFVPYGRSLAEALVYDLARARRNPAFRPGSDSAWGDWAGTWVGVAPFWSGAPAADPYDLLVEAGISGDVVRRDRAAEAIQSVLRELATPQLAHDFGGHWERDMVRWLFDTDGIPAEDRRRLVRHFKRDERELLRQDWGAVERHALAVARSRRDLAWAFDLAGWAAERRGDLAAAIALYRDGVRASLFSDESVRFRTHWFSDGMGKFSAARLAAHRAALPGDLRRDPYLALFFEDDPESLRGRVRDYWMDAARSATAAGESFEAYTAYYRAGWDFGLEYVKSYEEIMDGLVASATAAGSPALAAVARLHRANLGA